MSKAKVRPYIMRGLMGFLFPKAMYPLAKMLQGAGYNTTQMLSWQINYQNHIYNEIVKLYNEDKDYRFAIIGHSLGGNAGTELSLRFEKAGIPIHYLAIIDAPMPKRVGDTILVCDNFYQFNDFRNPILKTNHPERMKQYNFRRRDDGTGIYVEPENHIGLGSHPFVMSTIMEQIENLA